MGGAFQTSRDIFNNPIWQDIQKFRIFFYIVGNAVFSPDGVRMGSTRINRGQYLRSYRNLADDLQYIENRKIKKYSISVISRKIDQLVKEERLKIEDTELGTLFTVINYDQYQTLDNYKSKLGTELEQSWNTDGTQTEHSWNNNKKVNKDKKDKKDINTSRRKQVYDKESVHYKLAFRLYENILENNPEHKEPNLQNWSNEVRLMMEQDKRTYEQIEYLIDWVQKDSFWKSNILSIKKLREKFDQLAIKVKEDISKQNRYNQTKAIPRAYQSLKDWADEG